MSDEAGTSHGAGRASSILGGTDMGVLCIAGSAVMCSLAYRWLLPRLRSHVVQAAWWSTAQSAQTSRLWQSGFPRTAVPPAFPAGTTYEMTADMFAWYCAQAGVNAVLGVLTLPAVLSNWEDVGSAGQASFLLAVIFAAGWCLFDTVDGTMRTWLFRRFPTGCSGLTWPCPKGLWLRNSVLHNPFWLTLIVPMNAHLPQLETYHYLACSLLLSAAWQHGTGQYGLTLDLSDACCLRRFKKLVALQLLNAVGVRGILFATLALNCGDELHELTGAELVPLPAMLMLVFNVAAIIDAVKAAVLWLPAKPGTPRALRQEATVPLQSIEEDTPRAARGRRPKKKTKLPGRAARQPPPTAAGEEASDDELVFDGTDGIDGTEDIDQGGVEAPTAPTSTSADAVGGEGGTKRPRRVYEGLVFGKQTQGAAAPAPPADEPAPADSEQPRRERTDGAGARRAESVVFPSKWRDAGAGEDDAAEEDGISMVSAPITPLERQRRTAHAEREQRAAAERQQQHADDVERARSEALEAAEQQRQRAARRKREVEQQKREAEDEMRGRRRKRADASAVRQAQQDTHERGERLRKEAEHAAKLSRGSTEPPPMVDHDAVLLSGRLPKGTHYEMLGVARDVDDAELKRAFHRLSKKWHPDKLPDHVAEAETVFKAVKFAYDVLADATKRRRYDAKLGQAGPGSTTRPSGQTNT